MEEKEELKFKDSKICFLSNFPPKECGIATFTQDLISSLNSALGVSTLITASVGINYAYSEVGMPLLTGNLIEFASLPTISNVLECINTR